MGSDLQEAKERLLAAAEAYQPFGYVRKRPLRCVGAAFAAGFLAGKSSPARGTLALLPALLQTLTLAEKIASLSRG